MTLTWHLIDLNKFHRNITGRPDIERSYSFWLRLFGWLFSKRRCTHKSFRDKPKSWFIYVNNVQSRRVARKTCPHHPIISNFHETIERMRFCARKHIILPHRSRRHLSPPLSTSVSDSHFLPTSPIHFSCTRQSSSSSLCVSCHDQGYTSPTIVGWLIANPEMITNWTWACRGNRNTTEQRNHTKKRKRIQGGTVLRDWWIFPWLV